MAQVVDTLGQEWQTLTHMTIKLVPGGHPHHAIAEASAQAARMANVPASEISAIVYSTPGMKKIPGPRHPENLIDIAHSPIYLAAAGVADGGLTWAHQCSLLGAPPYTASNGQTSTKSFARSAQVPAAERRERERE